MKRKHSKIITFSTLVTFIFVQLILPINNAFAEAPCWNDGSIRYRYGGNPYDYSTWISQKYSQKVNDPINIINGAFTYEYKDFSIPSRGMPLEFKRFYNSKDLADGPFGVGWSHSFNIYLVAVSDGTDRYLLIKFPDGHKDIFKRLPDNTYQHQGGTFHLIARDADYIYKDKQGAEYKFNLLGRLISITDRNNNQISFSYTALGGQLIRVTDTVGRNITFSYNANKKIEMIIDSSGRTWSYGYNGHNELVSMTTPTTIDYPQGNTITYSYNGNHLLAGITDARGNQYLTNQYNDDGRVIVQNYGGRAYSLTYNTANLTVHVTDRKGNITIYQLNEDGTTASKTMGSDITSYQYNSNKQVTKITYPRGNWVKYTYDNNGNLLEIRKKAINVPDVNDPTNDIIAAFTYEPRYNFIKSVTDPEGNVTAYYYDHEEETLGDLNGDGITSGTNGNLVKIEYQRVSGQTPTRLFTYNEHGQILSETFPNGNIIQYEYYPDIGYLRKVIQDPNGLNYQTQFAYDEAGNVISATDARGNTTAYVYNNLSQLIQVTSPEPFNYRTKYSYENGNLVRMEQQADEVGNYWQTTAYTYTVLGQLQTITDNLGNTTVFDYDANDNLSSKTDSENNLTAYEYNEKDLLCRVTDVLGNITEYSYDGNGNLEEIIDANSNITAYVYDDFDRLVRITYPDLSFEEYTYGKNSNLISKRTRSGNFIEYSYDALNRLDLKTYPDTSNVDYIYDVSSRVTDIIDANGTISYVYDVLNRITSVNNYGKTVGYEYDQAGNRTKLIYPDNTHITYEYDQLNRLTAVNDRSGATIASYSYDVLSRRTQLDLANNTQTIYQYDEINRMLSLINKVNGGPDISSFIYTYDNVGNKLTMATQEGSYRYAYDNIYQLASVDYPDGVDFLDTIYNYDAAGNRKSVVNIETTNYTANNINQYISVGETIYTYDNNGNLTSDGINAYTYDNENRLTQSTAGANNTRYVYDSLGRRIQKNINGVITNYIYNGDQVIGEYNGSGNLLRKFIYGSGIDEPILMDNGSEQYYYHFNKLGSVTGITDTSGTVVERYKYDAYGNIAIKDASGNTLTESAINNSYYFTGRDLDTETGLYYYRARYYSPSIGRFLQTDIKTWQPNDPRILQRSNDVSEFSNLAYTVFPYLKYNVGQLDRISAAIVQKFRPDTKMNLFSKQLIDEKLVSIFVQMEGTSNPRVLHAYSYTLNNPVNLTDPSGEFAPQLVAWVSLGIIVISHINWFAWCFRKNPNYLEEPPETPGAVSPHRYTLPPPPPPRVIQR